MNNFTLRKVEFKSSLAFRSTRAVLLTWHALLLQIAFVNLLWGISPCHRRYKGTGIRQLWCSSFQMCSSLSEAPEVDWGPPSLKVFESTYCDIWGNAHDVFNLALHSLALNFLLWNVDVGSLGIYVLYCEQLKELESVMEFLTNKVSVLLLQYSETMSTNGICHTNRIRFYQRGRKDLGICSSAQLLWQQ